MTTPVVSLAKSTLAFFDKNVHPMAVRIRTPFPTLTPFSSCDLPKEISHFIKRYEPKTATHGFFPHQAEFLRAFLVDEKRDFIITTATGSGKSLCFWAWVFEYLRRDPQANALLCFPTQALMWGQAERLRRISLKDSLIRLGKKPTAYGGAVALGSQKIGWTIWQGIGRGQTYNSLLDELLGRERPHICLASATLASAREFGGTLFFLDPAEITHIEDHVQQEIDLVDAKDVPRIAARPPKDALLRSVVLLTDQDKGRTVKGFMEDENNLGTDTNVIYFSQSKFRSKMLARDLAASAGEREVCVYDADLPPEQRRELEARLNAADSSGITVLGTSALELGVDIEGLDVCLMDVTPPRRADLLQRIGRVGRRVGRPGFVVLKLSAEPHDQEILDDPIESFRLQNTRALPIPLHLEMLRWRHVLAAYLEWMGDLKHGVVSWDQFNDCLIRHFGERATYRDLKEAFDDRYGTLIDTSERAWVHKGFRAAASEGKISLKHGQREVARIDDTAVFRDAHPGAVFLGHDLCYYRVVAYEGNWKIASWEHPDSETVLGKWLKST